MTEATMIAMRTVDEFFDRWEVRVSIRAPRIPEFAPDSLPGWNDQCSGVLRHFRETFTPDISNLKQRLGASATTGFDEMAIVEAIEAQAADVLKSALMNVGLNRMAAWQVAEQWNILDLTHDIPPGALRFEYSAGASNP